MDIVNVPDLIEDVGPVEPREDELPQSGEGPFPSLSALRRLDPFRGTSRTPRRVKLAGGEVDGQNDDKLCNHCDGDKDLGPLSGSH